MARRIINIDDVTFQSRPPSLAAPAHATQKFDARMAELATELGAQKLGYNITEIPPGAAAFPLHNHRVNEEMFFILSGTGEVRLGDERHPLRAGDIVACPPGDDRTAHQIINS